MDRLFGCLKVRVSVESFGEQGHRMSESVFRDSGTARRAMAASQAAAHWAVLRLCSQMRRRLSSSNQTTLNLPLGAHSAPMIVTISQHHSNKTQ